MRYNTTPRKRVIERRREAKLMKRRAFIRNVKSIATSFAIVFVLAFVVVLSSSSLTKAKNNTQAARTKYYTSVEVKAGDTLTSIANAYISYEYDSIDDYISEIKNINGLTGDDIHAGKYLKIAYYK